jgi:hypothetical protein
MNRMPKQPEPGSAPPPLTFDALNEHVLGWIAENVGDSARCVQPSDGENPFAHYRFEVREAFCLLRIWQADDGEFFLSWLALLGRCFHRYHRALRWLATNRAGLGIGLRYSPETADHRDLAIEGRVPVFAADGEAIHRLLHHHALDTYTTCGALHATFPETIDGGLIGAMMEEEETDAAEKSEAANLAMILEAGEIGAVEKTAFSEGAPGVPVLRMLIALARSRGRWEDVLRYADLLEEPSPEEDAEMAEERRIRSAFARWCAYRRRGELEKAADAGSALFLQWPEEARFKLHWTEIAESLVLAGRLEEAEEIIRDLEPFPNVRVHLVRAMIHAARGDTEAALEKAREHMGFVGRDLYAEQILQKLAGEDPPEISLGEEPGNPG